MDSLNRALPAGDKADCLGTVSFSVIVGLPGLQSSYTEKELQGMVKNLLNGLPVQFDETLLDRDRPFYILGLAPNAARWRDGQPQQGSPCR